VDILKIKKWGVNVYNDTGNTNPLLKGQSLSNDDFFLLYKTLFDLWLERDDPSIEIREIDTFISGILGKYSGI
jgi:sulfatase maturation enzyme AslB (radical SAM superfamily)